MMAEATLLDGHEGALALSEVLIPYGVAWVNASPFVR